MVKNVTKVSIQLIATRIVERSWENRGIRKQTPWGRFPQTRRCQVRAESRQRECVVHSHFSLPDFSPGKRIEERAKAAVRAGVVPLSRGVKPLFVGSEEIIGCPDIYR